VVLLAVLANMALAAQDRFTLKAPNGIAFLIRGPGSISGRLTNIAGTDARQALRRRASGRATDTTEMLWTHVDGGRHKGVIGIERSLCTKDWVGAVTGGYMRPRPFMARSRIASTYTSERGPCPSANGSKWVRTRDRSCPQGRYQAAFPLANRFADDRKSQLAPRECPSFTEGLCQFRIELSFREQRLD